MEVRIENYRECPYAETWLENGVTVQKYKRGLKVDIHVAKVLVAERLLVADGVARPGLADITGLFWTKDAEAMSYLSSDEAIHLVRAGAFCVSNFGQRMAMNFFMSFMGKPKVPTKIFKNREDALIWLDQFKEKANA